MYQLQIQYKSFLVEKEIQIPSNDVTLVFPAMFPITFQVFNSRGMKIGDAAIQLSRGGKTIDLKSNVSGTMLSVPPGSYVVSVLSQGQIISQRSLKVVSDRSVDLFTTQEPVFPLLVIVVAGIIVLHWSRDEYNEERSLLFSCSPCPGSLCCWDRISLVDASRILL